MRTVAAVTAAALIMNSAVDDLIVAAAAIIIVTAVSPAVNAFMEEVIAMAIGITAANSVVKAGVTVAAVVTVTAVVTAMAAVMGTATVIGLISIRRFRRHRPVNRRRPQMFQLKWSRFKCRSIAAAGCQRNLGKDEYKTADQNTKKELKETLPTNVYVPFSEREYSTETNVYIIITK
jgi:hypothetical protein